MTKNNSKNLFVLALALVFSFFLAFGLGGMNNSTALAEGVEINATTFPDEAFRAYVSATFDSNDDGSLSADELAVAKVIDLSALEAGLVKDITGIELLTSAEEIWLGQSAVPWADLSALKDFGFVSYFDSYYNTISITTDEDAKFDLATIVPDVSKIKRDNCWGLVFESEETAVVTVDTSKSGHMYVYGVGYSTLGLTVNLEVTVPGLYKDVTVTTDAENDAEATVLITDVNYETITSAKAGDVVVLKPQDGASHYFKAWQVINGEIEIIADYYEGEGSYYFYMPNSPVEIKALYAKHSHKNHGICGKTECSLFEGSQETSCEKEHAPSSGGWKAWGNHPWHEGVLPQDDGSYYLVKDVVLEYGLGLDGYLNLCLNGYNVKFADSGYESNLYVGAQLTLCDCNSTNQTHKFKPNEDGAWVLDEENGTKIISGGSITGSTNYDGNVYIGETSTLYLFGGNIVGAYREGYSYAPGVTNLGVFEMYGGSILGNEWDGVTNLGTFSMHGGNIEYNGFGVNNADYFGYIYIDGTSVIKNNSYQIEYYSPINTNLANFYGSYDNTLFDHIQFGELKDGAEIGISHIFYDGEWYVYEMGAFTAPLLAPEDSGLTDNEYAKRQVSYFFSDCEDYVVRVNDLNQIEIVDGAYPTDSVEINEVNFPDKKFRNEVSSFDMDDDGCLSPEEIYNVTYISLFGDEVEDITGVEYFTNLRRLTLILNKLKEIDVSNLKKLEELELFGNGLTELDLSENVKLTYIDCGGNFIENLVLPVGANLEYLDCSGNKLSYLDLSDYGTLESLDASHNAFGDGNIILPNGLIELQLAETQLSQIDLSQMTSLAFLNLEGNLFTQMPSIPRSVYDLSMRDNKLTSVSFAEDAQLVYIYFKGNNLTSVDLTPLSNLSGAEFSGNYFKITYVENKFDLTTLPEGFDVSKASSFENGSVEGNILTVVNPNAVVSYVYDMGNGRSEVFHLVAKEPKIAGFDFSIDEEFLKPVAGEETYRDKTLIAQMADGCDFAIVDADWYDFTNGEENEGLIYPEYYCEIDEMGYKFLPNTVYYLNIDVESDGYFFFLEDVINEYKLNGQSPIYYEINSKYSVSLYYAMPVTGDLEYIDLIDEIEITSQVIAAPAAGESVLRDEYALIDLLESQKLVYGGFTWGDADFNEYDDFYENGRLLPQEYFAPNSTYSLIIFAFLENGFNFDEEALTIIYDGREAEFLLFDRIYGSVIFGWTFQTGAMPNVNENEKYVSQINLVFGEDELPPPGSFGKDGQKRRSFNGAYRKRKILLLPNFLDVGGRK